MQNSFIIFQKLLVLFGFMLIGYNLTTVGSTLYTAVASTAMITIPGYIFAGSIMANGGISKNLLEALKGWIGHVPGGIAIVTVLACALFAAITGCGWSDDPGHERIEL